MSEQYKLKWFKKNNGELVDLSATEESISNAEAGIYVVSVTDRNDISATFELELTQTLSINATFRTVPPQCINLKTGSIELATIDGGVAPYTITWNKDLTGSSLSNLEAGRYFAVIKDKNGCYGEAAVNLRETMNFSINLVSKKDIICKGTCEGELQVTITGTGALNPYSFSWQNGATTSSSRLLTKRCAGIYTAAVTAAGGCRVTKTFEIKEPEKSFSVEVSSDLQFCKSSNVEINATQPDGKAYKWIFPDGALATTPVVSIIKTGQYKVEVTNSLGCKASDAFNVTFIDVETSANFALSDAGLVGGRIYAVNLSPLKAIRWRVPEGIKIDYEGNDQLIFIPQKPGVFKIEMIVSEDGCEAIVSKTITIFSPPNGRVATQESVDSSTTAEEKDETFIVYPNPSNGILTIELLNIALTDDLEFKIFDANLGRSLYSNKNIDNGQRKIELDLKDQPTGVVYVVMIKNGKKVSKKVIIQK